MAIKDKKKISLNQTKPGWYKRKPETLDTKKKRKRSWKLELGGAEKEERKIHRNEKTTRQKGGGSKD